MTPNHDFTNAKVGDNIHAVRNGVGTIKDLRPDGDCPVWAEFKNVYLSFTIDGKQFKDDIHPTAFTEPVKIVPASYEPFVEQEMMVWDDDIEKAKKRVVFANPRGKFAAYIDSKTIEEIGTPRDFVMWDHALPIAEWEAKVKESKNQKEIAEIELQITELQAKLEKLKG